MDFFEAQARAKKRTSRLLVLFGLAVAGTIAATYLAAVFGLQALGRSQRDGRPYRYEREVAAPVALWQPKIFGWVSLGTLAVVGCASLYKWNEYSAGGRVVAEGVGGRRVDPRTTDLAERRLLNVVEEMAIASGIPVPAAYILDEEPAINAFAAGLTSSDAVVAVNRGTLEKLTRDELQAVVGHEFSHILNGDMRLNLRIAATVFGILVLGLLGRGILWSLRNTRVRTDRKSGGALLAIAAVGLALMIIGYVGYFFGRLIQAAVSRQREFLADASAVQFTRNPAGMIGALRKIGGYALGSNMQSANSAAIGHFFFAQAFRSGFTGWWSTHPPLEERIRAIDPQFAGGMFEPAEVVDVAHESFVTAGLAPAPGVTGHLAARGAADAGAELLPARETQSAAAMAQQAVASVGTLTPAQIANAQLLLESTPPRLRDAAHDPREAPVVVFALLLADDAAVRMRQRALIQQRSGADVLAVLDELEPALAGLRDEHRLPLLQLALPSLREIPADSLAPFIDTLDELVHADQRVSTFEFALQKLITRTLTLGRAPNTAVVQFYSFNAVADEIGTVLSALAHAATSDPTFARAAFATGAAHLKLIEAQLRFREATATDLAALDAALDKLAAASGPIKQRLLTAAAHVVTADGRLLVCEAELLRAVCAALDLPMPPLQIQAAA